MAIIKKLLIAVCLVAVCFSAQAQRQQRRALMNQVTASSGGSLREPDLLEITFTNGSGITVNSTVGPNATNNVSTWITGKSGSGYALRAELPKNNLSTPSSVTYGTNEVTVCAWVRLPVNAAPVQFFGERDWNSYDSFSFEQSAVVTYLIIRKSGAGRLEQSCARLPSTNWVHVAAVFDANANANAGEIKLYYDGVLQNLTNVTSSKTGGGNFASRPLNALLGSGSTRIDFDKDHIAVFSGELSQSEIIAQGALAR